MSGWGKCQHRNNSFVSIMGLGWFFSSTILWFLWNVVNRMGTMLSPLLQELNEVMIVRWLFLCFYLFCYLIVSLWPCPEDWWSGSGWSPSSGSKACSTFFSCPPTMPTRAADNCCRRPSLGTHLGYHMHLQCEGLHTVFPGLQPHQKQLCCVTVYWGRKCPRNF